MINLRHTIIILLLLTDDRVRWSLADEHRNASDSPFIVNIEVKNPNLLYELTTIKSKPKEASSFNSDVELIGAASNSINKNYNDYSSESFEDSVEEPPDHEIPYTEHENPREPQTRPNYTAPGNWAKPPPDKNIPLDFIPSKTYAQVRGTHTVKHLPREAAIHSAENDEEKENAGRLKEVVKVSKANTVYTEEGYEDAAYDHAGQIRDADFHEGFARRLNEEMERKKSDGRKRKRGGKKRHRQSKSRNDDFSDDYIDHLAQIGQEARTSQKQIKPESINVLKHTLKNPIIHAKAVAEEGIRQLDEDLRQESYESQRTSTEPYATTTYTPLIIDTTSQEFDDLTKITTTRNDVYTIRPRKPTTPTRSKPRKRPQQQSSLKNNDYSSSIESTSTIDYPSTDILKQYLNSKENVPVTYSPVLAESQTSNPVIANPLAIATVNGHGPYLVLVTDAPDPITSNPNQGFETSIRYVKTQADNVTNNPYLPADHRNQGLPKVSPQQMYPINKPIHNPITNHHYYNPGKDNPNNNYQSPSSVASPNHAKVLNYLQSNNDNNKNSYMDYYTIMQPPKSSRYSEIAPVTYPNYSRRPQDNNHSQAQWAVKPVSERPVESVYDVMTAAERPPRIMSQSKRPGPSSGMTKLLPPSPVSTSEYASFRSRNRYFEPISPTVIAMVPIIEAIQQHEEQQSYFPFLFRKKRSAVGREREIEERDRREKILQNVELIQGKHVVKNNDLKSLPIVVESKLPVVNIDENKQVRDSSEKSSEEEVSNDKSNKGRARYSTKFKSPSLKLDVNKEIRDLYKSSSEEVSKEASSEKIKKPDKSKIKYPTEFKSLLNESPNLTLDVVNKEIRERFKDDSSSSEEEEEAASTRSENDDSDSQEDSKEETERKESKDKQSVEVDVPELDFSSVFEEDEVEATTRKPGIDVKKYPFYKNSKVVKNSPLKYISNPLDVPRKTLGGMEFYDSRNLECGEIDPNLEDIVPEEEELANKRGPRKGKQRLRGLGDKVDCYKAKFFDEDPLDNPLFHEKSIENPVPPAELDPKKFASRILDLPDEKDEYVVQKGPKSPEDYVTNARQARTRYVPRRHHSTVRTTQYGYPHPRSNKTPYHQHRQNYGEPPGLLLVNENRVQSNKTRVKPKKTKVQPLYQRQVYEDVMGTIMNLESMRSKNGPKRSRPLVLPKYYKRDHQNGRKRLRPNYGGLIPPSAKSIPYRNNKLSYPTQRSRKYYDSDDRSSYVPRVYKRSVDADEIEKMKTSSSSQDEKNNTSNKTLSNDNLKKNDNSSKSDDDVNDTSATVNNYISKEVPEKLTFRIVLTTPESNSTSVNLNAVTVKPTTQETVPERGRGYGRPSMSNTKFDKFKENITSSVDKRRNEPRYNVPTRRITNNVNITVSPEQIKLPELVTKSPVKELLPAGSTIIPVIVKPDKNYTIPQESKANVVVKKNPDDDVLEDEQSSENSAQVETEKEKKFKEPKNQYKVHENIREDPNDGSYEIVTDYDTGIDSKEHKELYRFLQGDPPGYAKAFANSESHEDDTQEKSSLPIEEPSNDSTVVQEAEVLESNRAEEAEEEPEQEVSERNADTAENKEKEEKQESEAEDEEVEEEPEEAKTKEDDEPFERYSFRPYSPPENYEDEKYADLGPRINKPYFYHPPFRIPEYERRKLGQPIDSSNTEEDEEDYHHGEAHPEKYVFPWEKDDKEDDETDESRKYDTFEYPWERRERKERERRERERLLRDFYGDEDDDETEESSTNTKLTYVPISGGRHSRGVNKELDSKFSSKYKSDVPKNPVADEEESLITVANGDEIKRSILSYLEGAASRPPKIKTSEKRTSNKTYIINTSSSGTNGSKDTDLPATPKATVNSTTTTIPPITTTPISTTVSSTNASTRGRSRKVISRNDKIKYLANVARKPVSSTAAPSKEFRRRGRIRDVNSSSNSTTSTVKPTISRRRGRPVSSTSAPPSNTTTKSVNDKRRRAFRIRTTTSLPPTSTVRTIEHHSRVSKEEIITKTFTDNDDDDSLANGSKVSAASVESPKNDSAADQTTKKEKVEKVTITMEETPEHVRKTKEVDKDGVKGKFVTITANGEEKSSIDPEIEEMQRRMDAFQSFDSVIRDTEALSNESSAGSDADVSAPVRRLREIESTQGYRHVFTSAVSWATEEKYKIY